MMFLEIALWRAPGSLLPGTGVRAKPLPDGTVLKGS